ncbi:MAG: pentapeptide repeat-containing protein [Anaerolineales bacterium]
MKTPPSTTPRPPRFPKRLPAGSISALQDDGEYAALELSGCHLAGQSAARAVFDTLLFRKAVLGPSRLSKIRMTDCRLETSDLSGIDWEKARFRRVEFVGCRIIGAQLLESEVEDALFKDCNLERAILASAKLRSVRFLHCSLREASFEYSDVSGAVFEDCDLTRADLRRARMRGADLRGSTIDGVQAGPEEFSGVIVDSAQALQITGLLGLIIKEKGEDPFD